MRSTLVALVCTMPALAYAGPWYVDASVPSTGDGRAWATAWKSLDDIAWTSIQPGDTIWVAAGTYAGMTVHKGGTAGSPVRIKVSQETGHSGAVTLTGGINVGADWVTIDGAKSDDYVTVSSAALDDVIGLRDDSSVLASNIGLFLQSTGVGVHGINVFGVVAHGLTVQWAKISTSDDAETYGIRINPSSSNGNGGGVDHFDFGYLWIQNVGQDGVKLVSNTTAAGMDAVVIHHTLIEGTGDDGIEAAPGLTVHHSVLRDTRFLHGHPDGIAAEASINWRIYNNVLYDWATYPFYPGTMVTTPSNLYFYGNLIYWVDGPYVQEVAGDLSVSALYDPANTQATWSDVVIANNTLIAGTKMVANAPYCASNHDLCGIQNPFSLFNRYKTMGVRLSFARMIVENNVFYGGNSFAVGLCGPTSNIACGEDDAVVDYNAMWSPLDAGKQIYFLDQTFATAESLNAGTKYKHNTSDEPVFVSAATYDFAPTLTGSGLRDRGDDLSRLALHGLDRDLRGAQRGADGAWDIGAIEAGSATRPPPSDGGSDSTPDGGGQPNGSVLGCSCNTDPGTLTCAALASALLFRRRRAARR